MRIQLVVNQIAKNLLMSVPLVQKLRTKLGRTGNKYDSMSKDYLDRYAYDPFAMIVDNLGEGILRSAVVAEVGPGDHIPTALLCLGAGVNKYICCDRFAGDIAGTGAKKLYGYLFESLKDRNVNAYDLLRQQNIEGGTFPESAGDKVECYRDPIEELSNKLSNSIDLIYSYNVVEHLYDVKQFANNTFKMLANGGVAIHRVDYGPHDAWLSRDNQLEWLTVSDSLWQLMGTNRGIPNRLRHNEVVQLLTDAGFVIESKIINLFLEKDLKQSRAELASRFYEMSDEDLLIRTAFLICRKPLK